MKLTREQFLADLKAKLDAKNKVALEALQNAEVKKAMPLAAERVVNLELPKGLSLADKLAALGVYGNYTVAANTVSTTNNESQITITNDVVEKPNGEFIYVGIPGQLHPVNPPQQLKKHEVTKDHLNAEQLLALTYAQAGISFCLIGSAGTGKTTTQQLIARQLAEGGLIRELGTATKFLTAKNPSIVFVSFTNPAVANIKTAVPEQFKSNCLTIHKLCEFTPEYYENAEGKNTMRFQPNRNLMNPIHGITHVVVEESGTVNLDIAQTLFNAIDNDNAVFIFLGDLNQLPPAFGDGILGYKLLQLPVVNLTQVYRTADDSPIKKLALRILEGKPIGDKEFATMLVPGELEAWAFPKRWEIDATNETLGAHFAKLVKNGDFNPDTDVLLIPYNKLVGTIEFGKHIAQARNEKEGLEVYEIISGINRQYFCVGDLVYHNKRKCKIVSIEPNDSYIGNPPQVASTSLNRWGLDRQMYSVELIQKRKEEEEARLNKTFELISLEDIIDESEDGISRQASHIVTIQGIEDEIPPVALSSSGDINAMYFAHCLTVYKAQGSEWDRVFCLFHHCHSKQLVRETIYTAITRARKYLKIYYENEATGRAWDGLWHKAILAQRIPGENMDEKLKYFMHKMKVEILKAELISGNKILKDNERGETDKLSKDTIDTLIAQLIRQKAHGQMEAFK